VLERGLSLDGVGIINVSYSFTDSRKETKWLPGMYEGFTVDFESEVNTAVTNKSSLLVSNALLIVDIDISKKHVTSIFRVLFCSILPYGFLFGLVFDPKYGVYYVCSSETSLEFHTIMLQYLGILSDFFTPHF
jgi:hypothetical protein